MAGRGQIWRPGEKVWGPLLRNTATIPRKHVSTPPPASTRLPPARTHPPSPPRPTAPLHQTYTTPGKFGRALIPCPLCPCPCPQCPAALLRPLTLRPRRDRRSPNAPSALIGHHSAASPRHPLPPLRTHLAMLPSLRGLASALPALLFLANARSSPSSPPLAAHHRPLLLRPELKSAAALQLPQALPHSRLCRSLLQFAYPLLSLLACPCIDARYLLQPDEMPPPASLKWTRAASKSPLRQAPPHFIAEMDRRDRVPSRPGPNCEFTDRCGHLGIGTMFAPGKYVLDVGRNCAGYRPSEPLSHVSLINCPPNGRSAADRGSDRLTGDRRDFERIPFIGGQVM